LVTLLQILVKSKTESNISLDDWYNHFRDLFSSTYTNQNNETGSEHVDLNTHFDEIEQLIIKILF
jgi:hypothetical protein